MRDDDNMRYGEVARTGEGACTCKAVVEGAPGRCVELALWPGAGDVVGRGDDEVMRWEALGR